jgi:hypothetical protein
VATSGGLSLITQKVLIKSIVNQLAQDGVELPNVFHAVHTLPTSIPPLRDADLAPARESAPVGLDQFTPSVKVGLLRDSG